MTSNTKTTLLGNLGKADSKTTASNLTAGRSNTAGGLIQPKGNYKNYGKPGYWWRQYLE